MATPTAADWAMLQTVEFREELQVASFVADTIEAAQRKAEHWLHNDGPPELTLAGLCCAQTGQNIFVASIVYSVP